MYPEMKENFVFEAFKDATSIPYGYLFLDMKVETPEDLRVRSRIFPGDDLIIYGPNP